MNEAVGTVEAMECGVESMDTNCAVGGVSWASILAIIGVVVFVIILVAFLWSRYLKKQRQTKNYERGLKMMPMLIHLPPTTDDIEVGGRDQRDVLNESLSEAQVMYSIIASIVTKGFKAKVFGQKHLSFEIIAAEGMIKYYAVVPAVLTETVKQAIVSSYPTARLEEIEEENIFSEVAKIGGVAGGELSLKKEYVYPIATYEDTKKDANLAILNALNSVKQDEGVAIQVIMRPTDGGWTEESKDKVDEIKEGKKHSRKGRGFDLGRVGGNLMRALWEPPTEAEKKDEEHKPLSNTKQEEISAIENKMKYPGFESLIRIVASAENGERAKALLGGVVASFSQFDSPSFNGFRFEEARNTEKLTTDYIFRFFDQKNKSMILNSMELASIFHLPAQNAIPTSKVERQSMKQVDGPAKVPDEGILLGVNEFRGETKEIRLATNDRRRHVYVIGSTGMGKSVLMKNIAYQDMMDGRGFAFLDPHGDAVEDLLSMVPPERMDDVIYFDPADLDHPIGMNMFEFNTPEERDLIIQEGIDMLYSIFDPGHTGIFGPRGEHMFRNAALLLMSDPAGATFLDIPSVFTDPELVKSKLKYVTDKAVYDYWTKEFPASQRSNDAGEVITWFSSKWGPFLANTMLRNVLGQTQSGFNIREMMDNKKIFLVNLSKGRMGEQNAKLLGMILVMKFQMAAMSRADMDEKDREDFCLFVDEFQNFSTESFESILSEARKFRLNLFVANQFLTQLTDKIREGILGNVGTIMSGRLGVTDAEMLVKAFAPTFDAEDLHQLPNYHAIATVMMYDMPSKPFTMKLLPPIGEKNDEVRERLREYSAAKYSRTRAEVEKEFNERTTAPKEELAEKPATEAQKPLKAEELIPEMPLEAPRRALEAAEIAETAPKAVTPKTAQGEAPVASRLNNSLSQTSAPQPIVEKKPEEGPITLAQSKQKLEEEPSILMQPKQKPDEIVFKVR